MLDGPDEAAEAIMEKLWLELRAVIEILGDADCSEENLHAIRDNMRLEVARMMESPNP